MYVGGGKICGDFYCIGTIDGQNTYIKKKPYASLNFCGFIQKATKQQRR